MFSFIPEENFKKIIDDARSGEKESFNRVFKLFFAPVYRYIYLRVKDKKEVDILTQEVFSKAYNSLENIERKNLSPLSFLFTVAKNIIIDFWRKNRKQVIFGKEDLMLYVPDQSLNPEESFEMEETRALLYKAINMLKYTEREAVNMKYLNGISNKEISKLLGKNEESVRQLQAKGIKSLRSILRDLSENK